MSDMFGPPVFRYKNVLAVDDEPDVVAALKDILETSFPGVQVTTATSGAEGLRILSERNADIIITDYKMPKMDGLRFLEAVERIRPGIPHIILTAYDRDLLQRKPASRDAILQKPIDPTTLLRTVSDAMTRILLVDDEPDILLAFQQLLALRLKAHVETADSGARALESLAKGRFDLLVSDQRMPGLSGIELIAKAKKALPNLRCVLFTAYSDPALEKRALASGADLVLTKSVPPAEFAHSMRRILGS